MRQRDFRERMELLQQALNALNEDITHISEQLAQGALNALPGEFEKASVFALQQYVTGQASAIISRMEQLLKALSGATRHFKDREALLEQAKYEMEAFGYFIWGAATELENNRLSNELRELLPGALIVASLPVPGGPMAFVDKNHPMSPSDRQLELYAKAMREEVQ